MHVCTVWVHDKGQLFQPQCCVHEILGDIIDVKWIKEKGEMHLSRSNSSSFSYKSTAQHDELRGLPFRHNCDCPLLKQHSKKSMKPCVCVMIELDGKVLVTQRTKKLSFAGASVLPGGHLEVNESILEGGLRECQEETGLVKENCKILVEHPMMAWESVAMRDSHVSSTAIVIFFALTTLPFAVKIQPQEVEAFSWVDIHHDTMEPYSAATEEGYPEGHMKYLQYITKGKI